MIAQPQTFNHETKYEYSSPQLGTVLLPSILSHLWANRTPQLWPLVAKPRTLSGSASIPTFSLLHFPFDTQLHYLQQHSRHTSLLHNFGNDAPPFCAKCILPIHQRTFPKHKYKHRIQIRVKSSASRLDALRLAIQRELATLRSKYVVWLRLFR